MQLFIRIIYFIIFLYNGFCIAESDTSLFEFISQNNNKSTLQHISLLNRPYQEKIKTYHATRSSNEYITYTDDTELKQGLLIQALSSKQLIRIESLDTHLNVPNITYHNLKVEPQKNNFIFYKPIQFHIQDNIISVEQKKSEYLSQYYLKASHLKHNTKYKVVVTDIATTTQIPTVTLTSLYQIDVSHLILPISLSFTEITDIYHLQFNLVIKDTISEALDYHYDIEKDTYYVQLPPALFYHLDANLFEVYTTVKARNADYEFLQRTIKHAFKAYIPTAKINHIHIQKNEKRFENITFIMDVQRDSRYNISFIMIDQDSNQTIAKIHAGAWLATNQNKIVVDVTSLELSLNKRYALKEITLQDQGQIAELDFIETFY